MPAMVQHLLNTAVFVADRAMLGHYSTEALAAMQIAGPIRWITYSIFTAFSAGTIAVVARHVGAGEEEKARQAAASSLALALAVGACLALATVFLPAIVALFEPSPTVARGALHYLRCTLGIAPLLSFVVIGTFVLQAAGDTRTPMLVSGLANLVNIVGNWLLIFGNAGAPELGILGAGLASAIAVCIEFVLLALVLRAGISRIRVRLRELLQASAAVLRPILRISLPAALEQLVFHSGFLCFTIIVGWLGTRAMAANQAAVSIESVCFLTADAFGIAGAALVGQRLGAGQPQQADVAGREAAQLCVYWLLAVTVLFYALPEFFLGLFTPDQATIAVGALALQVGVFELPFLGLAHVIGRSFRGAGQTRFPLVVTALGVWGVRVPLSYLLGLTWGYGLTGVWIATLLDWFIRAVILAWGWQRGRWKGVEVE